MLRNPFAHIVSLCFISSTLLAQGPTTAPSATPLSGTLAAPVQLFNGKNFTGWVWVPRPPRPTTATAAAPPTTQPLAKLEDVWSIKDGVIVSKGRPVGYLRTEQSLAGNYVLTVEMRHVARGNGGILVGISGPDKVWPHCLEVQGASDAVGEFWLQGDFKLSADPARVQQGRHVLKLAPASEKPLGEWDTVQIIVDRGSISVTVNDVVQNVAKSVDEIVGMIGLQSEGAPMEFRRIDLTQIQGR